MALSSMTGFARGHGVSGAYAWAWEIKSVNGKGLDVRLRLPPGWDAVEPPARQRAAAALARGTVYANLTVERKGVAPSVRINEPVLAAVLAALKGLDGKIDAVAPRLDGILALKGVIEVSDTDEREDERLAAEAAIVAGFDQTLAALVAIDPSRIDHKIARGLATDAGEPGPSGFAVLLKCRGLILLAVIMLIFHWGNAPMSRLIAQQFSIELGTPFRTTAITTGVSQLAMIAVAASTPWLIRRFGLSAVFLVALAALPLRGLLAGSISDFWVVYPVQALDGIGAGLLGIVTPVAAERLLSGTGRFNVGFAAVMTVQGIGASLSNVVAGWLVTIGGYGLSHHVGGGVAIVALAIFILFRKEIPPQPDTSATAPGRC